MRILFIIFIVVPLVEMLLLFEVSDYIGGLATVGLVVLTAVIGVQILKRQGFSTLLRANQRLQSGELPAQEIVEGMLLAAAGALLLTPGFITDTLGFIFLTGPLRRPLARWIISRGIVQAFGRRGGGSFYFHAESGSRRSNVMEGEYTEVADRDSQRLERDDSEENRE